MTIAGNFSPLEISLVEVFFGAPAVVHDGGDREVGHLAGRRRRLLGRR